MQGEDTVLWLFLPKKGLILVIPCVFSVSVNNETGGKVMRGRVFYPRYFYISEAQALQIGRCTEDGGPSVIIRTRLRMFLGLVMCLPANA